MVAMVTMMSDGRDNDYNDRNDRNDELDKFLFFAEMCDNSRKCVIIHGNAWGTTSLRACLCLTALDNAATAYYVGVQGKMRREF